MNCPKCRNTMTSETIITNAIVVTHTCPNCQNIYTVTFGGDESNERHQPNAVGHILTVRHWNQVLLRDEFFKYQIIGISKDRFGRLTYLIPQWNSDRNFFAGYPENSSFFHSISETPEPMNAANQSAAAFIRYNRIAALCHTLYVRYAWMDYPVQSLREEHGAYGIGYIPETVYELDAPLNSAQIAKRKKAYYARLAQAALDASGLKS